MNKTKTKTKTKKDCKYHTIISTRHYAEWEDDPYYAKLVCISCGKVFKWLTVEEYYKL